MCNLNDDDIFISINTIKQQAEDIDKRCLKHVWSFYDLVKTKVSFIQV